MNKITCWCCGQPSGQHKMSCNTKSKVEGLVFMFNEIYLVPDETLELIINICKTQLDERRSQREVK